jgi:hypothetical protein
MLVGNCTKFRPAQPKLTEAASRKIIFGKFTFLTVLKFGLVFCLKMA